MNAVAAHALWAAEYDDTPNPLLALERRIVLGLLPDVRGLMAVDVACGTGRWARELSARGARVAAADLCGEMVGRAPAPRIIADAARLPLPDGFAGFAVCAFAFSYTGACLEELARVTQPGGWVVVSDMHPCAMNAGWTRSFHTGERRITIDARRYPLESLHAPGLRRERLVEAAFGEPEFEVFRRAGRLDLWERTCGVPAVFAARWVRDED